jgi:predicted ArsR family transcriptional regulator
VLTRVLGGDRNRFMTESASESDLPFLSPTRSALRTALQGLDGWLSVAAIASRATIPVSTALRVLKQLESEGLAESRPLKGFPGRPSTVWRLK